MRLLIVAFAALSILSPCVVRAAEPLTCQVDARSDGGGRVQVSTFDHSAKLPFDMPPQLSWQPPSTTDTVEMVVGWYGGKALGDLTGGHVMFTPRVMADAGQYWVRVTSDDGEVWDYGPGDLEVGAEKAELNIDRNDPRGRAILAAIGHGTRMKIDILLPGKIEQTDIVDPSNTSERNKLVAYARHLAETNDPRVCKPI